MTGTWPPSAEHLWRVGFTVSGATPPEVPEALDDEALSVTLLAVEDPVTTDPVAWRVELLASISLADLMKQESEVQELVGISSAV